METNRKILIFSNADPEVIDRQFMNGGEETNEYDFACSLPELLSHLKQNSHDLTIIDSSESSDSEILLEAIAAVVEMGQPIMIKDLQTCDSAKLRQEIFANNNTNGADVPQKMPTGTILNTDEKRRLISEVVATLNHEINNPLLAISVYSEMLLKNMGHLDKDSSDKLKLIARSAERIKFVTERLNDLDLVKYRETPAGRMIDLDFHDEKSASDKQTVPELVE